MVTVKKKHKWTNKDTIITSVVVIISIIALVLIILSNYICFSNGQARAKNGQCCPYGATIYREQCYSTDCTGVRNKNGVCCIYGVTNTYKINCINAQCPKTDVVKGVCCLYGKTHFGANCLLSSCNATRTLYSICCHNGLASNDESCNQTCANGPNTYNGGCCDYGVANNNMYCKTKKCANGAYTNNGKCCTNGATVRKKKCNIQCNSVNHIMTTYRGNQLCCPNGINAYGEAGMACKTVVCNNVHSAVTLYGKCCPNGIADNNIYCNKTCSNPKSLHTLSGECCPQKYGLNNNKKCYTTTCNNKKGYYRSRGGVCCTNGINITGVCNQPCPKYGSNTSYGKCCPHKIAPGVYNSYMICNQTCTTGKGNNLKQNIDNGITFTNNEHSIMGQCCKSGLTTRSWKYCNSICKSITVKLYNEPELAADKDNAMNKNHKYGPSPNKQPSGINRKGIIDGNGIQHQDINKQHLSTGKCCEYGMTDLKKACFTTSCPAPKARLVNNSKVCCMATSNRKNCKTQTVMNLISDMQQYGIIRGAMAYKCGNEGVCGYNPLKCAPNCSKPVSYFCNCCQGKNACLTTWGFGLCGTKVGGICL
jgi:hypothetical protein